MLSLALCAATALLLSACGDSSTKSQGDSGTSTTTATAQATAGSSENAATQLKTIFDATSLKLPEGKNPAVKGKNVWVISIGQASPTAELPVAAMMEAGKKIGWDMHLYDAKLDPANYPAGIREAVANKADALITISIDCTLAKAALQEAKKAGVKTVTLNAYDCKDEKPSEPQLYDAQVAVGPDFHWKNMQEQHTEWGAVFAPWVVAQTGGKGTILNFANDQLLLLRYMHEGFAAAVTAICADCKVKTIQWNIEDFGPNLTAKTKAALLQNPDTTAIFGATNPEQGISQGVVQAGKATKLPVAGGLSVPSQIDLVRSSAGLDATMAYTNGWFGWAAIDTVNSLLGGTAPRDPGLSLSLIDREHNMPAAGKGWDPDGLDYRAAYEQSWAG
jgi:ribose transport system substrate-binding protein